MAAMPVLPTPAYRPPWPLRHGHLSTIYPVLFRRQPPVAYRRQRIETPDGDFLDLDWSEHGSDRIVIVSHGLEGSARGQYVQGIVHHFTRHGWDAVAWNCRGCSGELNRTLRFYHSGSSDDLDVVVQHVARTRPEARIALVGFSLGGNMTLKYVGEREHSIHPSVKAAVAFSVPCDLHSSSIKLAHPSNSLYMMRFMYSLNRKIRVKAERFPGAIRPFRLHRVRSFKTFDDLYTAPLHGFDSAEDYWARASSRQFLPRIRIPTLLVQAANDPFLAPPCFPYQEARDNPHFYLEVPRYGGHCAWISETLDNPYYCDRRALAFLEEHVPPSKGS